MKKNLSKKVGGFTLIELMVAISLIAIVVIWWYNLDFNRLSWRQRLEIFSNKVISNIETIRNNALLWKWAWINLDIPPEWKIDISSANSWSLSVSFLSWATWYSFPENSLITNRPYQIDNIQCVSLNHTNTWSFLGWTWTIIVSKWDLSLSWCSDSNNKIIKFDTIFTKDDFTIEVNTLNWLIRKF